jgi:hypothetical protein
MKINSININDENLIKISNLLVKNRKEYNEKGNILKLSKLNYL